VIKKKSANVLQRKPLGGAMPTRNKEDRGMVRRLKDQLAVFKRGKDIHENRRKLDERAFYPAHDKRKETAAYKAVHEKLVKQLDLPCLVCGIKYSTLKDKTQNRYGAKQLETHHHIIEWALANAICVEKFNSNLLPHLRHKHNRPEYQDNFTAQDITNWVDHHEDNLWVLCDVHHRAKYFGIHEISYPIWAPMDLLRDDFEQYVKSEVAKEKSNKSPSKLKPR